MVGDTGESDIVIQQGVRDVAQVAPPAPIFAKPQLRTSPTPSSGEAERQFTTCPPTSNSSSGIGSVKKYSFRVYAFFTVSKEGSTLQYSAFARRMFIKVSLVQIMVLDAK